MGTERHEQGVFSGDLARSFGHLTRALLDPAPSQVEWPRVAVVPAPLGEPVREQAGVEPVVLRLPRGVDLLAELAFLDR